MAGGRAIAGAAAVLLAASALGGSTSQDGTARGSSLVLYEGARVITGDGSPPIEDGALLVRGATIERVGVRSAVKAPTGARHVDLRGKTVMPLIMDVHGHIGYLKDGVTDKANYSRENVLDHLRRYMYYGVGAIQSLGTDRDGIELQIRDEQRNGTLKEPGLAQLLTADQGLVAPTPGQTNGGPAFAPDVVHETTSPEDARQFVRLLATRRPDIVKLWVDDRNATKVKLTPELYRPIIDEAHKQGLRAVAHVYYLSDAKELVRAGVDGFAHLTRDAAEDEELVQLIKARNVFACTTMSVQRGNEAAWLDDPALAETTRPEVVAAWKTSSARGPAAPPPSSGAGQGTPRGGAPFATAGGPLRGYSILEQNVRTLHAAGARIVLCGDTGFARQAPGFTEHRELQAMVDAGMPPLQAIRAATEVGAEVLRLRDRGTLARGKRADFMVLDANPLENIANSRKIAAVYHGGVAVDREQMRSRWTAR
jgi:imidazolonepropionase-like amidohydrolase